MQVPELLNVGVVEEENSQLLIAKHLPRIWNSVVSILIQAAVKHKLVVGTVYCVQITWLVTASIGMNCMYFKV